MEGYGETRYWPVAWSAVWVGALAALAAGLVIGLLGFAVGAHEVSRAVAFKNVRFTTLAFSIAGAFFSAVIGGWVAGRIAGFRRSEPAMLHGAVVWLVVLPMLLALSALGATWHFGGWYTGLAAAPVVSAAADQNVAAAMRNNAFASLIAILLGLVGSVIGGWMASGEPMSLTYYRRRELRHEERPRRIA
ncbi:MAG TPA: hypothetical protein VGL09_12950 [Methylomirabilota bacterium]|jgi:hypothetical protein